MLRLSQTQLKILEECPRKFQHSYLELLASTASPEHKEKLTWGSHFHLLMQQRELGLSIESITQQDPELGRCVAAFINAAPELFANSENSDQIFRQAEHPRILIFQDYLFTVIYDLLIAEPNAAKILDWKTYPRPQKSKWIAESWQTRLYLYVLVETSDYSPEQVSMTYWFVQLQGEEPPQKLTFSYNQIEHDRTKQDLTQILQQLTDWRQRYTEGGEFFPQVQISSNLCDSCQFATRCNRTQNSKASSSNLPAETPTNWLPNLAIIEEISI
ncbi:MAG: PD-(D/E)XK nuclease family protein [Microcoleus sp. PH2017_07_MST_O_A]|nr:MULTISPECIES: PD-(D/E)XK nuclease family protein [unclassified Microcoleus]MCC3419509.1 PD-(D/E)XK nuclease family protein [Microcoleus sp. PH2017_07_MST_O_A]MCC3510239.1 PD-(D/E)XK nuclease family protein [Microcoleus sp. PH2017_17_BER_D_A]MCC3498024.1 PD-(D/E)XK nuclease family protein [Microcoleus sp. PH2017_15_JOR_U_A]MCC3571154.1 PD-(D/E)XK nuclease family protein [Microcoleus sp. PH2017_34_RAT_O_A]MCC3608735.1 PD-(D/E)XK nuclease family protein [Microcoleus sp. PH2017_40_RAT_O_B]